MARRGLEKIKTIGDAYMVIGGISTPRDDHAEAVCDMALAIRDSVQELGGGLTMRIGVHTGPVVAGVIGKQKFIYDAWGDTVNTASRMESHGVPGRIQVTGAIRDDLSRMFEFEERGAAKDDRESGPCGGGDLVAKHEGATENAHEGEDARRTHRAAWRSRCRSG